MKSKFGEFSTEIVFQLGIRSVSYKDSLISMLLGRFTVAYASKKGRRFIFRFSQANFLFELFLVD